MEYKASDKYNRMKREYQKLIIINSNNKIIIDDVVQPGISNTDSVDGSENFFNQCYHLKDWIKKDSSISLSENIEDFINKSESLSLCADYCNSFKHGGLDKNPRSGKEIEKVNTHINLDLTPTGFVASSRSEITISGKKYDAFLLATDCIKEWDDFLKRNQIKF
ncbi:MAG: hypothetical protein PHD80_03335 [Candidatus ainarchaeum sp.]|jgi:predicted DNA-binding protein|nr:hypothetical protein [Candidatus ainarchaeum sp.]